MATIPPFLWFDTNARRSSGFLSVGLQELQGARDRELTDWISGTNKTVPTATFDFELEGLRFTALNAGRAALQRAALALHRNERPAETDYYWQALTAGGGVPRDLAAG